MFIGFNTSASALPHAPPNNFLESLAPIHFERLYFLFSLSAYFCAHVFSTSTFLPRCHSTTFISFHRFHLFVTHLGSSPPPHSALLVLISTLHTFPCLGVNHRPAFNILNFHPRVFSANSCVPSFGLKAGLAFLNDLRHASACSFKI